MNPVTLVVFVLLVVVPGVPLVLTWRRVLARGESASEERQGVALALPLLVATLSCLLFFVGLFYQPAIGPDYSHRRFVTIYVNLAMALLMAITALFGKHGLRGLLALSAGAVALVWLYLAVVSSVV